MKFVIMALITISAASASARFISCADREMQDATLSATFDMNSKGSSVSLFVPTGETSGETFKGECQSNPDAIELDLTCNVMTSTDSGYEIKLVSPGGPTLISSFTPWSMSGKGKSISLPCDRL